MVGNHQFHPSILLKKRLVGLTNGNFFVSVNNPAPHAVVASSRVSLSPKSSPFPESLTGGHIRESLGVGRRREVVERAGRKTGWWQLKYLLFSSLFGEDEPNLTSIFFRWVGSTTIQKRFCCQKWLEKTITYEWWWKRMIKSYKNRIRFKHVRNHNARQTTFSKLCKFVPFTPEKPTKRQTFYIYIWKVQI